MLLKFAIKNLLTRRRRSIVSIAGISVSIALLVSTMLILKSARGAFEKPIKDAGADIIVQVQGEPCVWSVVKLPQNLNPIPIETLDKLRSMDEIASAEGSLIVWAFSSSPHSQTQAMQKGSNMQAQEILEGIATGKLEGEPCDHGTPGSFCGAEGGGGGAGGMSADFSPIVVAGINPEAKDLGPLNASYAQNLEGRYFSKDDTYVAILDKDFARTKNLKPGDNFDLGQRYFKIIGTVDAGRDAKIAGAQAFVPLKTAIDMTGRGNIVDIIFIKLKGGASPDLTKEKIKKLTSQNATITTSNDFLSAIAGLTNLTHSLMLAILFITLFFSFLFIIKTSFGSVLERSSEIGIFKAIGWKDKNINALIFIENCILGTAGGIIGSAGGYIASLIYKVNLPSVLPYYLNPYPPCSQYLAKNALHISTQFSADIFLLAISLAIAIQSFSGFFASNKILKRPPADAMRHI